MKRIWKRALLWLYQRQLQAAWEDAYERTLEAQRKQMAEQASRLRYESVLDGVQARERRRAEQSRDLGEAVERRKRMN